MNHNKILALLATWLFGLLTTGLVQAQNLTMTLSGDVTMDPMDMDAMSYYPVKDQNDELCALIKVRLTNELKNPLILSNGAVGVTKREERPDGEYWFWVPYQTKNLFFSCRGYDPMEPIPVQLNKGRVYRIEIRSDAVMQMVTNATISFNYLRMHIEPAGATVSIGTTPDCSMYSEALTENDFFYQLNYGDYYYRIEHPQYETLTGKVTVSEKNETLELELKPAYSYLNFVSEPSGAQVFVNGKFIGKTPVQSSDPYPRGEVSVRMQLEEYAPMSRRVQVVGDGQVQQVSWTLQAQYANVTCTSEDPMAEIWVDNQYRAIGSWTGHLNATITHVLEARKTGHQPQSVSFTIQIGETSTQTVGAPVPLYGIVSFESTPGNVTVWVDDVEVGKTPMVQQILVGKHQVRMTRGGYATQEFEIEVEHNQRQTVSRTLSPGDSQTSQTTASPKKQSQSTQPKQSQSQSQSTQPKLSPRLKSQASSFTLEFNYGVGFESQNDAVRDFSMNLYGGTFNYQFGKWGGYVSGLYGVEYGDFAVTVGPVYGGSRAKFFAGVGMIKGEFKTSVLADVGLRVKVFSVVNLSVSCKVGAGYFVPTAGVALSF